MLYIYLLSLVVYFHGNLVTWKITGYIIRNCRVERFSDTAVLVHDHGLNSRCITYLTDACTGIIKVNVKLLTPVRLLQIRPTCKIWHICKIKDL